MVFFTLKYYFMNTKNYFKVAMSVANLAFFLFLAGGSDEGSDSSSSSNSSEEYEYEESADTIKAQQPEEFVPMNDEVDMTPESDEFIPQGNETEE